MTLDTKWIYKSISGNSGGSNNFSAINLRIPPTGAGNLIIVAVAFAGTTWTGVGADTAIPSITDNTGTNTWLTTVVNVQDSGGPYELRIWVCANCSANTQDINITWASDTVFALQRFVGVRYDCALSSIFDGQNNATIATGTAIQSGSFSTTQDNDVIIQFIVNDAGGTGQFTPDTGYSLVAVSEDASFAVQSTIQAAHGATNPTLTSTNNSRYFSITFAIKQSIGAGVAPDLTKSSVRSVYHFQFGSTSNTYTTQFPTHAGAKALVAAFSGDGATVPILKAGGFSGSVCGVGIVGPSVGSTAQGACQFGYKLNPTVSDAEEITLDFTGHADNSLGSNCFIMEIVGPDLTFDKIVQFTGNEASGTNADITWGSINPSAAGGILIGNASVADGHEGDALNSWVAIQDDDPNSVGTSPIDEDNSWAWISPTSTSSQSYGNHQPDTNLQFAGNWSAEILSLVPIVIPNPPIQRSLGPGKHVGKFADLVIKSPQAYIVPSDTTIKNYVPHRPLVRLGKFSFILDHRQNQGTFNLVVVVTLPPTRTLTGVGI